MYRDGHFADSLDSLPQFVATLTVKTFSICLAGIFFPIDCDHCINPSAGDLLEKSDFVSIIASYFTCLQGGLMPTL